MWKAESPLTRVFAAAPHPSHPAALPPQRTTKYTGATSTMHATIDVAQRRNLYDIEFSLIQPHRPLYSRLLIESERKRCQVLHAVPGDQVLILQPDSSPQFRSILPRFRRENLSLHQHVIPPRIQVRILVRLKANPMAEVMAHPRPAHVFLKCSSTAAKISRHLTPGLAIRSTTASAPSPTPTP